MINIKYKILFSKYDDIVIYGAGKVGAFVYKILKMYNSEKKVSCYVISDKIVTDRKKDEIPIKSVYDVSEKYDKALFVLAVGDQTIKEIKYHAKELHIKCCLDARKLYRGNLIERKAYEIKKNWYIAHEMGNKNALEEQVTHITYCMVPNAGDTMLSWCVRKHLPYISWCIKDVSMPVDDRMIESINHSKGVIIGGGGLFLPDTNANLISGWQWAIREDYLIQIEKPLIVYAVGYNFFKGQENTELFCRSINCLVEKAQFVGLRNKGSVVSIQNILRDDLKSKVCYQPCATTLINRMYPVNKKKNTGIIGVNIAFDREERRYGSRKTEILSQIADAIKHIEDKGYTICYIAHCDEDFLFLKYLDDKKINYTTKRLSNKFPKEIIKCYENVDLMFGMRGHAQMIPFGVGCRIITLGSHDKMKWFLEDIDALDWYINITEDVESLSKRIKTVFQKVNETELNETNERLCFQQERLWQISCRNREKIEKIIKN